MVRVSADIGNGDAAVCDSDRELHMQAGPRPARAVERDPADGLHAVFEAGQASAPGEVGAADAVVADRDAKDFPSDLDLDADG